MIPLKPHCYIVRLRFTGVYIIFLILLKKLDCGYLLELPQQGSSNEYQQSMFWAEIWKISEVLSENFQFLVMKFSVYLNRHVFIMSFTRQHNPVGIASDCKCRGPELESKLSITKTCPFKYTENFITKKWKVSDKKFWYFSYFCSKCRLWVLVRTVLMRQF